MPVREVIIFSPEDQKLLDAMSYINERIKEINSGAKDASNTIAGLGSTGSAGRLDSAFSKLNGTVKSLNLSVGGTLKGLGKLAGLMGGSLALASRGISSAFNDMQTGLENIVQIRTVQAQLGGMSASIDPITDGLIDLNNRLDFFRMGVDAGFSRNQIQKIVQMGTVVGLSSNKVDELRATQMLFEASIKGTADELANVDPKLGIAIRKTWELSGATTQAQKAQLAFNTILGQSEKRFKELSDSSLTPFLKMLGFMRKMKEESKGLFEVMGGLGKLVGSALLPVAGGLAAFAFGGPIVGALGLLVGGGISAAIAALGTKLVEVTSGDKGGQDRIGGIKSTLESVIAGLFSALGSNQSTFRIPLKAFAAATGLDPETQQKEIKKQFASVAKGVASLSGGMRDFSAGFMGSFSENKGKIYEALGYSIKQIRDMEVSTGESTAKALGGLFGNIAVKAMMVVIKSLPAIATSVQFLAGVARAKEKVQSEPGKFAGALYDFAQGAIEGNKEEMLKRISEGRKEGLSFEEQMNYIVYGIKNKPTEKSSPFTPDLPQEKTGPILEGLLYESQKQTETLDLIRRQRALDY